MVVGKSLLGVAVPNVTPRLGRLRPGKRANRPPLGLLSLPVRAKLICPGWKPSARSFGISIEAMIELCEMPKTAMDWLVPGWIARLIALSSAVTPRAREMSSVRSLTPVTGYNPSAVVMAMGLTPAGRVNWVK